MEVSGKILRRSIHSFLQNFHYFTSTPAFLAFPLSASLLLSQALIPSYSSISLLPQIYNRFRILFEAAASVIQALNHSKPNPLQLGPSFSSIASLYKPLLTTYFCNSFLIISANASAFCLLFLAFGFIEGLGYSFSSSTSSSFLLFLSASGVVLFSVILANALVICNMALALSGMEGHGGCLAILKACVLIRGRTSMALFLALPVNVALAAIEALFQFRVVRAYNVGGKARPFLALEGIFIAYLYSVFIVLDTIVSCMFYKYCKMGLWIVDQKDRDSLRIEFSEENNLEYIP
ncbi:putative transmembrane protein [Senna tora]|uniref:Putative transmembrane protein n=1 Tax=Senna tora TaxID=362788 RepID=A0A834SMF8_9FABA|nr:putative transmembrane protein [Senna tora]